MNIKKKKKKRMFHLKKSLYTIYILIFKNTWSNVICMYNSIITML